MNACTAVDGLLQPSRYHWTCPVLGWFEHTIISHTRTSKTRRMNSPQLFLFGFSYRIKVNKKLLRSRSRHLPPLPCLKNPPPPPHSTDPTPMRKWRTYNPAAICMQKTIGARGYYYYYYYSYTRQQTESAHWFTPEALGRECIPFGGPRYCSLLCEISNIT